MGRTIINYNLVAQSSNNIGKAASEARTTSGVDGELSNLITEIIGEGKNHDNCLAPYEGELNAIVTEVDNSINKMDNLSELCMVAFNAFLTAESNIVDGVGTIDINGTKFSNVKIESSGMKEYVNSYFDNNNLAGSINPNNLDGMLSEEEWQRYELMFKKAMNESTDKKEKAVIAAVFMTSVYPHIPYDWGGGHYQSDYYCEDSINKYLGETYNGLHCDFQEDQRLRTYDCSGFTSWVLREAGYPEEKWAYEDGGSKCYNNVANIVAHSNNQQVLGPNFDISNCSPGDIAYMRKGDGLGAIDDEHIGVIVAVDGDEITVAHVSGGGAPNHLQSESAGSGYTKINVKTGKVTDDSSSKLESRKNIVYFTHTASMD